MYLRQIELENFKSFGGKVTVPLMEGYMAITGPNGSGKSNIGDAIMFVLGPKSPKAVRAGRITDLIFSGGASKAKAKSMTVSLVFDNSDRMLPWGDDTVRLTRFVKLSDNGQDYTSYFYINDQKSTLSEFDSLLTKARISADGYNIVQQGDVTRIVQMGNIERRRILDGISGIASFDADIAKAQGERKEAEDNLGIIELLREDKEKQLKNLEKDREQARIYLQAKSELDTAKAQLTVRQRDREVATLSNLCGYIDTLNGELAQLREVKESAKNDHAQNEQAIADKESEIEARVGPEYSKIKADIEQAKIRLATEKDRVETAEADIRYQTESKAGYLESIEENRNEYRTLSESLHDLEIRFQAANAEYEAAKAEEVRISEETSKHGGELTELQKRLEILGKQIDEASAKDQDAKTASASAKVVREHSQIARADAEEAVNSAQFEVKDADWNLKELQKTLGPVKSEDLSKKILDLKREEANLESQEEQLRRVYEKRSADFNKLSAEKRASDAYNGAGEAVTRILQLRSTGEIPGIYGTIAELAKVEPGYETALSVAAGGKMQSIVVDTDATAARCIQYLKSNGLSRVSFVPLNKMVSGKPRAKAIMVLKRTEGYATDFLTYSPEFTNAFWYVFQDTLVTKTLDQAREIMGGIRIVTREGELIEAAGAMVGGTLNKAKMAKFGPASQGALDEAAEGVRSASEALECIRGKLRDLRETIRKTDDEMRSASKDDIDARGKLAAAQAALDQARRSLKTAEENLAKKIKDADLAEKDAITKQALAEATSKTLEMLRADRTTARERIAVIAPAGLQERIQAIRDKVYNCSGTVAELKTEIGGTKAELAGLDKQKEAYDNQVAEIVKRISSQKQAKAEHNETNQEITVSLSALRSIEAEMESGLAELKNAKDALIQRRYELASAIQKAQSDIETKEGIISSQNALVITTRQNIEALEEEVRNIKFEVPTPIPSEEALKRTIRGCEAKIDGLGTPNLRAIEDYDARKAEYDEMIEQVKVLNSQINKLDRLTEDLTSKKTGLFMEAYEEVSKNFKAIYAQLSGGGEAFMELEKPEEPFEGGLEINAKPRNGKRLRLEALSGGEKSLTALSFIFAIQEYQPSPFYVLDEVDMFLDAVNSEMVAKRVKESSVKAQFIQVSLRKVTLTLADHLIGVTRPPSGISRVIMQPDLNEVSKYEEEALRMRDKSENEG
ncbi:MAG: chromosome segregation protein SMC [archaeon]|nr:chromosome segregation protein SMC [archaeon]